MIIIETTEEKLQANELKKLEIKPDDKHDKH